jgi:hypothetical protein
MVMRKIMPVILPLCTIIFLPFYITAKSVLSDVDKITLVSSFETKNCCASFVMINGIKYLVKQKKDYKKQLAVVRDALAAYIAKDLAIAHKVYIISAKKKQFPGKAKEDWPATLHTLAPGETVRKQRNSRYNALRLKQQWAKAPSFEEKGMTDVIINYMTWHWQIPIIIALDLMIGNSDRHCGNLCYDSTTDSFCAIDMDDTFNKDLCGLACKKLTLMFEKYEKVFTQEEKRALLQMRNTLKFLIHTHKPRNLIAKLYYFAKKAGFVKGNPLYNDSIKKKLLFYETMIVKTNASAYKLIALIDDHIK